MCSRFAPKSATTIPTTQRRSTSASGTTCGWADWTSSCGSDGAAPRGRSKRGHAVLPPPRADVGRPEHDHLRPVLLVLLSASAGGGLVFFPGRAGRGSGGVGGERHGAG